MKKYAVALIAGITYEAVALDAVASAVCIQDCEDAKPHVELNGPASSSTTDTLVTQTFAMPPAQPFFGSTFVTALPQHIPVAQPGFINSFNLPLHG